MKNKMLLSKMNCFSSIILKIIGILSKRNISCCLPFTYFNSSFASETNFWMAFFVKPVLMMCSWDVRHLLKKTSHLFNIRITSKWRKKIYQSSMCGIFSATVIWGSNSIGRYFVLSFSRMMPSSCDTFHAALSKTPCVVKQLLPSASWKRDRV